MSIYLDYNATSPLRTYVKQKMMDHFDFPANASSVHFFGRKAKNLIDDSRSKISSLIKCKEENIIFTSGGTESNSTILKFYKNPLISSIEHDAVIQSSNNPKFINVCQNGKVDLEDLEKKLKIHKPDIVSVMWANNETGVIQPIEKVVSIANLYNVPVHCDAVQAFGKIPINFENSGLHSLSISAHKIGGPSGVGAMVLNDKVKIKPLILGGGQEKGRRSGTENFLGIIGFGFAVDEIIKELENPNYFYLKKERFEKNFLLKNKDAKIICYNIKRLHNTTAIFSPFMSSEAQVIKLDLLGFSVSAGSACSSGKINKSHVLRAMGLDWATNNTIRVSYGWQNDNIDLDNFTEVYKNIFQ